MFIIPETAITEAMVTSINATDIAAYSAGATYADKDRVSLNERIYESLSDGNTGNDPEASSSAFWVDVGPTNRAAFRDPKVTTQTTRADSLTIELELGTLARGLALFNVTGGSVTVEVDEGGGTIFSETRTLVDLQDATDAWEYAFTEPLFRTEVAFPDVPIYSGSTLRITITATGATAALGKAIIGRVYEIGPTLPGSGPKMVDYSSVTFDPDFGDYQRVVRDYAKGANFVVGLNPEACDRVFRLLSNLRGQVVAVFPGDDMERYGLTTAGFLGEFEPALEHRGIVPVTIPIKGII